MIGSAIRKFAKERGMTCDGGCAYGRVNGRHIFMYEGNGYKAVQVYLYPPVEKLDDGGARDAEILRVLTDCDLREFRLHQKGAVSIEAGYARLVFHDTVGTMKRVVRYIDEVLPKLDGLDLDSDRCACCGEAMDEDVRYAMLDGRIMPVHGACRQKLSALVESVEDEPRPGSIWKGTLGALLGAVIGAIVYAVVFALGYIAGIVGLLTGYLASKLYDKCGGKRSKWKMVVVAVMLVLGILLGQAAGYTVMFSRWYSEGGFTEADYPYVDYVVECWEEYLLLDQRTALEVQYDRRMEGVSQAEIDSGLYMTKEEFVETYYDTQLDTYRAEMRDEFGRNLLLGMFYGLLGCLGVFLNIHRQSRRRKVQEMK